MNDAKNNDQKIIVALLSVLAVFAACVVLRLAQPVVLPLIIAWLISYILGPVVTTFTRRHIPTGIAVTFVLLLLFGVCYLAGMFLFNRAMVFWDAFPEYKQKLIVLSDHFAERWDLQVQPLKGIDWWSKLTPYMKVTTTTMMSFLSKLVLVSIYLVFFLLGKPYFGCKLHKAFPEDEATKLSNMLGAISRQTGAYLSLQVVISFITGLCVWVALSIIGVDFAITWGAFAFFLNFIPTVGSIIASIPPVLVALVQFDTLWPAVATATALLTIQMVIGNGVSPKVMGDKLNLSPLVVLISLVFWGWLWGIVGALLSTPIAAAIKIVCENVEGLRPISVMMGSGKRYCKIRGRSGRHLK